MFWGFCSMSLDRRAFFPLPFYVSLLLHVGAVFSTLTPQLWNETVCSLQILCLSWQQAVKHDANWTFHPLQGQICCSYKASSLSWTEVERTDTFLILQLVQDDVLCTLQISAEASVNKSSHARAVYKGRKKTERRAKHPNKVNSPACIIYYSLIVILPVFLKKGYSNSCSRLDILLVCHKGNRRDFALIFLPPC